MPDVSDRRLSPATVLSLLHHPQTGRLMAGDERRPKDPTDDEEPRDCVRQFPTLKEDVAELVGYDINGRPRIKIVLPREDVRWWESLIMRYLRWKYGRPIQIVR